MQSAVLISVVAALLWRAIAVCPNDTAWYIEQSLLKFFALLESLWGQEGAGKYNLI